MGCSCVSILGNLGVPNCQTVFDVTKQIVLVPYFKNDGSINGIDLSTLTFDQSFIDSKIQANNEQDRWYITTEMKNVVDERAEDINESFEDGTTVFIQSGPRTFLGLLIGEGPALKKNLDAWKCEIAGYYIIDKSGNFIGDNSREGFLDPIRIQNNTLSTILQRGTDTTLQKLQLTFTVDQSMDDADLGFVSAADVSGELLGSLGLLDAIAENITGIATTGFTVDLKTAFGSVLGKQKVLGLTAPDFSVFNNTTSSAVTPTSVTELPDGTYTFVLPAQNSADVLTVGNKASGDLDKGFDINDFEVVIP